MSQVFVMPSPSSLPMLCEPEQLAQRLDDPGLIIVDLCRDEIFDRGHIPGAVHVGPVELTCGIKPATGKLPGIERLNKLFSRLGYAADKHIVAYDDEGGGWAGRFIWTLDVIGHQHSSCLNGGLIAWIAEDKPLTREIVKPLPTRVILEPGRQVIAEQQEVLQAIDSPDTVIWDARSPEEYAGIKTAAARGGHIPGAINLDWLEVMDRENHLKLRTDLKQLLADKGISGAGTVITHCQTHHRSGLTYLVGKLLGLNIKAYPGSWAEWGNDPKLPVELRTDTLNSQP